MAFYRNNYDTNRSERDDKNCLGFFKEADVKFDLSKMTILRFYPMPLSGNTSGSQKSLC